MKSISFGIAVSAVSLSASDDTIVVLDFESTGLDTLKDRVIEIGAVKMTGGTLVDTLTRAPAGAAPL